MRFRVLILVFLLAICVPRFAHAQYSDMDQQNPNEYSDDDSQLLRLASYVIAPLGWTLEWTVTRPLHYLATDTFLAPALGANIDAEREQMPSVPPLPPPDEIKDPAHAHDTVIRSPYQAPVSSAQPAAGASVTSGSQPAMH